MAELCKDSFIFSESEMSFEELFELPWATRGAKALFLSLKKKKSGIHKKFFFFSFKEQNRLFVFAVIFVGLPR